ncbi:MAG: hypothetical protein D3916_08305 [Candidatus Electrothrix sp. MAN1_4]|nr:hypothetical protein [Candidatus Electrothrix sp. MAN1_4]
MSCYSLKSLYFSFCIFFVTNIGLGVSASAASFLVSDLAGTWDFHTLVSGDSPQWTGWVYGSWDIGTDGSASWTSITKSDGNSALPPDSQLTVSSTGAVTISGTDFHGVMNAGKDMIAGVMTDTGGGYSLMISSKRTGVLYDTSDFFGSWDFHTLVSGDSSQWTGWVYGSWDIGTDSSASWTSITKSDGNSALPPNGYVLISSSGSVTIPGTDFHGVMNAGKDMIAGVMTDDRGGYNLLMFTKKQKTISLVPQMLLLLLGY